MEERKRDYKNSGRKRSIPFWRNSYRHLTGPLARLSGAKAGFQRIQPSHLGPRPMSGWQRDHKKTRKPLTGLRVC